MEVLTHLALTSAGGDRKPDDGIVERGFNGMSHTWVGEREDPSEDVAVHNLTSVRGNFMFLSGTWESNGFYLQHLVDTLESLGDRGLVGFLKDSAYALLRLSDEVCCRANLSRNELGPEMPIDSLPRAIRQGSGSARRAVRFTLDEIAALGIELDHLGPFAFLPAQLGDLAHERIGHSTLERHPLLKSKNEVYFALPTAVSPAITRFVIEAMTQAAAIDAFASAVAAQYATLFSRTTLLNESRVDVEFRRAEGGLAAAAMAEIDHGLYLNLIFVADELAAYSKDGMLGFFPNEGPWDKLVDHWIQQSWEAANARPDFVGGLTLVVPCGLGRGVPYFLAETVRAGWRAEMISAPDLMS